ncbi:MAG: N-acetylglucosamine/diacetylchitobiose ABC transporter substrate-binding protein [Jatrophihabitans sp.]
MNEPRTGLDLNRRNFLRGTAAAAALVPLGGALASCAGGGDKNTKKETGKVTSDNPFGVAKSSSVDAVIFNGGYGVAYTQFAGKALEKKQSGLGVKVKVTPATNLAQSLQPRFVGGNPPDVIDDSGKGNIGIAGVLDQLEDLTDVINAKNYEGKTIKDTLYPNVMAPGTYDGKFAVLNYVLTVYGLWYSTSLFEQNGWQPPKTWDEAYQLGGQAKSKGKYLFVWGKEAATYYLTLAISSAIKEGGDDVRLALDNIKADCFRSDPMQQVLTGMKKIIDAGYVKPGGAGTQFTAAQAQWSDAQQAILYPSGSWIENEMKDQTKSGFEMTGTFEPTVTSNSKFPLAALHSAAGEQYIVPSKAKNSAGGKEFLRAMLSADAAANFAKATHSPTIVKDTVPADGFGSTALKSQLKLLADAGSNVFTWGFVDYYGVNTDLLVLWNTFLSGGSSVKTLTDGMQSIVDKVRKDPSVKKIEVK